MGDPGEEPGTAFHQIHPGHGCSPDIRPGTDPVPGRRRGRSAGGSGGAGVVGGFLGYPSTRNPDRVGEIFGVLGALETGEGELVPPPLSPTLQPSCFSPASLARASCRQAPHTLLPATPTPPALLRGIPLRSLPTTPTPPAPSPTGYPCTFAGTPTPPAPSAGDPHALLRHPHPACAFGRGYPDTSPASPTPPAPSALLPRPRRGAWAVLAISGEQPYPALLQDLPMLWTVWISPRGEGPTERGNLFPLPCLPHSRHLAPCQPYPARAFMRDTRTLLPAAPTPPAPAALLPRPRRGRGPCPGVYQGSSRARGGAGGKSVSGSFPPIPWHWTVWISPLGVGLTGRGNSFPLPCLPRSQNSEYLTDPVRVPCRWVPKELAGGPHPARACGAPPPPPPGGGVRAWRYLVSSRIRGDTW